jgi:hypothetical protein
MCSRSSVSGIDEVLVVSKASGFQARLDVA